MEREDKRMEEIKKKHKCFCVLFQEADQNNGKISLNLRLNISIVNALWMLLVGEELELEDPHLAEIIQVENS